MGGFLRILLTAILLFYVFSMVIKLIFRIKAKRLERKLNAFAQNKTENTTKESKNPHVNPNIGEYTDFEEIE